MALISAAQFREHYPLLTGTGEDTVLDTMITRVDALLALYCGFPASDAGTRTMEDATYTVYPDGPSYRHPRSMELGVYPVVSITSVHVDADWDYDAATLIDSGDYIVDAATGTLMLTRLSGESWSTELRANKVVLVAGYATTPPDLVALAASTVRHLWDLRRMRGTAAHTMGGDQVTYGEAATLIPDDIRPLLGPYVLWESRAA